MLEIIKAIIYGIVEGITEWLPISSTGHLILVERLIPFQQTSEGFFDMFDVVIQLGAILAVVVLFWNKIWPFYLKKNKQPKKGGIVKSAKDPAVGNVALSMDAFWMWVKIVVACIPAVVYGGRSLPKRDRKQWCYNSGHSGSCNAGSGRRTVYRDRELE